MYITYAVRCFNRFTEMYLPSRLDIRSEVELIDDDLKVRKDQVKFVTIE